MYRDEESKAFGLPPIVQLNRSLLLLIPQLHLRSKVVLLVILSIPGHQEPRQVGELIACFGI